MKTILAILFVVSLSFAQKGSPVSPDQILNNIEEHFAGIDDYSVSLEVAADLERLKVPKMKATMYYKRPDKVRFVSDGFAMLPKEGFGFMSGNLASRFEVDSVREEQSAYILVLHAKADKKRLRRVVVAVNPANWTVTQMSMPQFEGRQMKAQFEYQMVDRHLLPSKMHVSFSGDTVQSEPVDPFAQPPPNLRTPQIPRKGTIEVLFSHYKLNTGLEDAFFEAKKDSSVR